jgi:pimeloyl-ACP methyl ester carboxylesterase
VRHLIAIAALGAALVPCAVRAADVPPIHVGSVYATKIGNGPTPLVLLPGLASGPWVWDRFVASLPAGKYTVYELTLAGFDGTPPVPGPNRFDDYAASIVRLVRDRHIARPILVGHSMGGELALRVGELEPQLPRGLVLVDAFPLFPPLQPGETLEERRAQSQAFAEKMKAASDADYRTAERVAIGQMVTDPKDAADVTARSLRSDRATVADSAFELATTDLHTDLGRVAEPTLVLGETSAGYSLETTKQFYEQQYAGAAGVTVTIVLNARHFIMLDQPDAFARTVLTFTASLR